jgi:hypothetical protein
MMASVVQRRLSHCALPGRLGLLRNRVLSQLQVFQWLVHVSGRPLREDGAFCVSRNTLVVSWLEGGGVRSTKALSQFSFVRSRRERCDHAVDALRDHRGGSAKARTAGHSPTAADLAHPAPGDRPARPIQHACPERHHFVRGACVRTYVCVFVCLFVCMYSWMSLRRDACKFGNECVSICKYRLYCVRSSLTTCLVLPRAIWRRASYGW